MFGLDNFGTCLFFLGAIGTTVYLTKMLLMITLGIGDDDLMDIDLDGTDFTLDVDSGDISGDVDIDVDTEHSSGFTWLSINIVTSFLMLFGWFGLATYTFLIKPGLTYKENLLVLLITQTASIGVGFIAGVFGIKLNLFFITLLAKFQQSGTMKMNNLLGQKGDVYIRISPGKMGTVMLKSDNGVLMEINASSHRKEVIGTGRKVKVIEVIKNSVIVEPVNEGE